MPKAPIRILCDYCDRTATRMIQRGQPQERSYTCEAHLERGRRAHVPGLVRGRIIDTGHNEQPEKRLHRDAAEAVWRASSKFYTVKRRATGLREERNR